MTLHLGNVDVDATLYIPFASYNSVGASITLTGLAVTDIEIYKDGGTTQRASDSGYALLDTDGIDFDGITGIHGFSIDLSDNTTAGFYAAGSQYWVIVSAVTIDGQTVNFIAATFTIGPAQANVTQLGGVEQSATDLKDFADAGYDPAANKVQGVVLVDTTTTNTDMVAAAPTAAANADAVLDEALSGHVAAGSLGKAVGDIETDVTATLADTNELQGDWTNGGRLDLIIDAILADTGTTIPGLIAALNDLAAADIWDLANGIETGITPRQAMRVNLAALAGILAGAATTNITFRDAGPSGDTKNRIDATVDEDGNRTAITLDLT